MSPRALLAVLMWWCGLSCAPMVRVVRDTPPEIILNANSVSVVAETSSGSTAIDVARAVLDPMGALSRLAFLTPQASRQVENRLARSGYFRVMPGCQRAPCPGVESTVAVHVVSGDRTDTTSANAKTRTYDGHATVELTLYGADGALLQRYRTSGRASGDANDDVVATAVNRAANEAVGALLPSTLVDVFHLAEKGPLASAAKLAAKGNLDAAEMEIRAYIAQAPDDAEARYHLGAVLTARADLEGAYAELGAAEQLDPNKYHGVTEGARLRIDNRERFRQFQQLHGR